MTTGALTFVVEDEAMVRALSGASLRIEEALNQAATIVAEAAAQEGGAVQADLGAPWVITGSSPTLKTVTAPEWWAHFFEGGTRPHGPTSADYLVFEIEGGVVRVDTVAGIPPSHFVEKAMESARLAVDLLITRAILEAV